MWFHEQNVLRLHPTEVKRIDGKIDIYDIIYSAFKVKYTIININRKKK